MKMSFRLNSENVNLYMETVFPVAIFEMLTLRKWGFWLFSDRNTIKFTVPVYESEIQTRTWNEFW